MRTLSLILTGALLGCGGTAPSEVTRSAELAASVAVGITFELPADWSTRPSIQFERLLALDLPTPSAATLERLAAALTASPTEATRAALLLSHLGTEQAHDLLLRRLEERVTGESREADAGDCTAARGLAGGSRAPRTIERLTALAAGPDPHPDLEVRTECAASLLCLGSEAGTPWLLAVLRIDTAEAERRGEQLTTSETTAWPRGRAAEVLCAYLGLEHRVWTDASLETRAAKALELEALLADR